MVDPRALPYEIEDSIAVRARIGLIALATDHVIEHELSLLTADVPGAEVYTTRVPMEARVTRASLLAMESRLTSAAQTLLPGMALDVIGYGCTSASVVIGEAKVTAAIHAARPGVPVTTPITARLAALRALGASKIGLLTPYVEEVNAPIRAYFIERGVAVMAAATFHEIDDNRAGMITPTSIRLAVLEVFSGVKIDAVFISCTSLRAAALVPELEASLDLPVTTSNHALAWHMLRLSGIEEVIPGRGRLFECPCDGTP